ncbi:hypothetical protein ACHQM5_013121 [Ranunculus cassubicifolius]
MSLSKLSVLLLLLAILIICANVLSAARVDIPSGAAKHKQAHLDKGMPPPSTPCGDPCDYSFCYSEKSCRWMCRHLDKYKTGFCKSKTCYCTDHPPK